MTTKECMQSLYEEEMNRVFAVSETYLMTTARRGCEREHAFHSERAEILQRLIAKESD